MYEDTYTVSMFNKQWCIGYQNSFNFRGEAVLLQFESLDYKES